MTFQQKRMVVARLTALIVIALVAGRPLAESSLHRVKPRISSSVGACLAVIAIRRQI
jgi:hypothetical protein